MLNIDKCVTCCILYRGNFEHTGSQALQTCSCTFAILNWSRPVHTIATQMLNTTLHAQVLAFSGGQRREEDLTGALVAAVAAARSEAGTYGVETPGEPAKCTIISIHPRLLKRWCKSTVISLLSSAET